MSLTNALKRLERDGKLIPAAREEAAVPAPVPDPNVRSEQQVMELLDRAEATLDAELAKELHGDRSPVIPTPATPVVTPATGQSDQRQSDTGPTDTGTMQAAASPVAHVPTVALPVDCGPSVADMIVADAIVAATQPAATTLPPAATAAQHERDQRAWDDADDLDDDEPTDYTDGRSTAAPLAAQQPVEPAAHLPATVAPTDSGTGPRAVASGELTDAETGVLSTWAELARLVQQAGVYDPPLSSFGGTFAASAYAPVILPIDDLLFADDEQDAPERVAGPAAVPTAAEISDAVPTAAEISDCVSTAAEISDAVSTAAEVSDGVDMAAASSDAVSACDNQRDASRLDSHADTAEEASEDDRSDILSMHRLDQLERLAREYAEPATDADRPRGAGLSLDADAASLVMEADMDSIFRSLGVAIPPVQRLDDELDAVLAQGPRHAALPGGTNRQATQETRSADTELGDSQDAEPVVLRMPSASAPDATENSVATEAAFDHIFYDSGAQTEQPVTLQPAIEVTEMERRIASSLQRPAIQAEMERIADKIRGRLRGDLPETMGCVAPRSSGRTADVLTQMALWLGPLEEDVLVVDANLADQSLTRGLRALDEPGLCEVLSKQRTAWEVVRPTSQPHLWMVPTGDDIVGFSRIPHQTDLNQLRELLQFWKTYFHRVFVDLGAVDSTLVEPFARMLDATILVVPGSRTSMREAQDAANLMRGFGKPPVGCILTDVPPPVPAWN